ncbi:hypothetical protein HK100_011450 [Physocladia obscura]|uniref:Raptor N-terminal CASPase-like domain-containing protein n=1 Tax=Physocladia obscura TaxID=109957 RepID=A0AAD5T189_9FUNG|nr:hypothetical protein HK100_011450 [Physocladia obscura]
MFLVDRRHEACGVPLHSYFDDKTQDWRMRERLKTVSVALVLCLNIGIDPPDLLKTSPCAKLECWVDPLSLPPQKALEAIGKNLQQQYEVWQPRSRYKQLLDPSVDETKKTCLSLRRNAKDERILFHYNGHGVPKPTRGGEIWVFNKSYTQYLPCSIYDIQSWLGSPCIYVFDCSNAGNILLAFDRFADQRDEEASKIPENEDIPYVSMKECILLVACGPNDTLPMNPDLPADLFTCCLTTPIEIALRWFVSQNPLLQNINADMIMKIPGQLNDRRTPLGELNWIFTAITDTIAWNMLPHDLFKKLFRQDLMVAALFRNFLLAERIMRFYNCTPQSSPVLPSTHQHPLWLSWDLAAEMSLYQLPDLLKNPSAQYQHSSFFSEQLTAFEVWLSKGPIAKSHPEQLPVVLQVLLSQVHRLRALMLLSRFLDLGPWSVKLALSVGIFPYVLKLLQSPAAELKPVLVFIWAKILALDNTCQNDLLKDNGFTYFINILTSVNNPVIPNMSEHRAMCAFILSVFCHNFRFAQEACLKNDLLMTLSLHLNDGDSLLRQWTSICISKLIENYPQARELCLKEALHERLLALLSDTNSEVRSAAILAVSSLIQDVKNDLPRNNTTVDNCICHVIIHGLADASPIVRKELVILLSRAVNINMDRVLAAAAETIAEDRQNSANAILVNLDTMTVPSSNEHGIFTSIYKSLLALSVDAFPLVAALASHVIDKIHTTLILTNKVKFISAFPSTASPTPPQLALAAAKRTSTSSTISAISHISNSSNNSINSNNNVVPVPIASSTSMIGNAQQQHYQFIRRTGTPSSTELAGSFGAGGGGGAGGSLYSSSPASSNIMKRTSSFVNPFKSLQGLASLVTFPVVNVNLGGGGSGGGGSEKNGDGSAGEDGAIEGFITGFAMDGRLARFENERIEAGVSYGSSGGGGGGNGGAGGKIDLQKCLSHHIIINGTMGSDGKPESNILLKSCFYEWSLEYFREPQMKVPDADDPGSLQYNQKLWRHQQNEKYSTSSLLKTSDSELLKFDHQVNLLHSNNKPGTHLYFHPFEPHLLASDDADGVIVYNWEDGSRINWFSNSNPPKTRITSLQFINENDIALIVTGSDEGIVRIYKNYTSIENCEIVSAWRAVNENLPASPRADLITDWHQSSGSLLVAGDLKMIRVWDLEKEYCVQDIGTKYQHAITSLTSEKKDGNILIAGFADGLMNMYDKRLPTRESLVATFQEHKSRILKCQFQNDFIGDCYTLVSGTVSGDVRVWDIRSPAHSQRVIDAIPGGIEMTALAIHDDAPLFACSYGFSILMA